MEINSIVSPVDNPWVDAVATVITFLDISPRIELLFVVKLWWSPVPKFVKNRSPDIVVDPIPTNDPTLLNPTFTVDTPMKLF